MDLLAVQHHKFHDTQMVSSVWRNVLHRVCVLAAKTTVGSDGKSVVLVAPKGVAIAGVRYCEQEYPLCVLRNGAGLPAMPFLANLTSSI